MRYLCVLGLLALATAGCESGGHFTLFGYSTRPNYSEAVRTVYVPIFENKTFRRGLEFELTKAVVRTIEQQTPFKVVSNRDAADTELCGTIVAFTKNILNRNQLNEVREAETVLTVAVVWKDLRTGEILSQPLQNAAAGPAFAALPDLAPGAGAPPTPPGIATQDAVPPQGGIVIPPPVVRPALVTSTGNFIPEVGQSLTTAQQRNMNRLATQIVALMEKPW